MRDQEEALLQVRALPGAVWEARWSDLLCDMVGVVRHCVLCERSSAGDSSGLRCAILSAFASPDERGACPGSGVLLWLALDDTESPELHPARGPKRKVIPDFVRSTSETSTGSGTGPTPLQRSTSILTATSELLADRNRELADGSTAALKDSLMALLGGIAAANTSVEGHADARPACLPLMELCLQSLRAPATVSSSGGAIVLSIRMTERVLRAIMCTAAAVGTFCRIVSPWLAQTVASLPSSLSGADSAVLMAISRSAGGLDDVSAAGSAPDITSLCTIVPGSMPTELVLQLSALIFARIAPPVAERAAAKIPSIAVAAALDEGLADTDDEHDEDGGDGEGEDDGMQNDPDGADGDGEDDGMQNDPDGADGDGEDDGEDEDEGGDNPDDLLDIDNLDAAIEGVLVGGAAGTAAAKSTARRAAPVRLSYGANKRCEITLQLPAHTVVRSVVVSFDVRAASTVMPGSVTVFAGVRSDVLVPVAHARVSSLKTSMRGVNVSLCARLQVQQVICATVIRIVVHAAQSGAGVDGVLGTFSVSELHVSGEIAASAGDGASAASAVKASVGTAMSLLWSTFKLFPESSYPFVIADIVEPLRLHLDDAEIGDRAGALAIALASNGFVMRRDQCLFDAGAPEAPTFAITLALAAASAVAGPIGALKAGVTALWNFVGESLAPAAALCAAGRYAELAAVVPKFLTPFVLGTAASLRGSAASTGIPRDACLTMMPLLVALAGSGAVDDCYLALLCAMVRADQAVRTAVSVDGIRLLRGMPMRADAVTSAGISVTAVQVICVLIATHVDVFNGSMSAGVRQVIESLTMQVIAQLRAMMSAAASTQEIATIRVVLTSLADACVDIGFRTWVGAAFLPQLLAVFRGDATTSRPLAGELALTARRLVLASVNLHVANQERVGHLLLESLDKLSSMNDFMHGLLVDAVTMTEVALVTTIAPQGAAFACRSKLGWCTRTYSWWRAQHVTGECAGDEDVNRDTALKAACSAAKFVVPETAREGVTFENAAQTIVRVGGRHHDYVIVVRCASVCAACVELDAEHSKRMSASWVVGSTVGLFISTILE